VGNRGRHAVEQWRKSRKPAWLIAALLRADNDDEAISELVEAAGRIQPRAAEYESAVYYGISREIARNHKDKARRWADEVLTHNLQRSSRNLILTERLKLARDWSEFLRFAPRKPETKLEKVDGREFETETPDALPGALFDADGTEALNNHVPLALWVDGSANPLLPPHLQLALAQTGWLRAILLGKLAEARTLMTRMVQLQPKAASAASEFLSATDPEAAQFAAVFLVLRAPSMSPWLYPGARNLTGVLELDRSGSGRWGFPANICGRPSAGPSLGDPGFLTSKQLQENRAELHQLSETAPAGASYLATQTLLWARHHPDDGRVPEALHLVVLTGRRGCQDVQTAAYSRQAFELLHRRYSQSEWARKTKYWYP
jgi:hypothetical protein